MNAFRRIPCAAAMSAVCICTSSASASATDFMGCLGLSPEALVVAGVSVSDASAILQRLDGAAEQIQQFDGFLAAAGTSGSTVTLQQAALFNGEGDAAGQALALAQSELAGIKAQVETLRQQLFTVAVEGLTTEQVAKLTTFRAGIVKYAPPELCAVDRSDEEWQAILVALRTEEHCAALAADAAVEADTLVATPEVPSDVEQFLDEVRSHPAAIEAQFALESSLPALLEVLQPLQQ